MGVWGLGARVSHCGVWGFGVWVWVGFSGIESHRTAGLRVEALGLRMEGLWVWGHGIAGGYGVKVSGHGVTWVIWIIWGVKDYMGRPLEGGSPG